MTNDSPFAPVLSRQSYLETLGAAEALRRLDDGLGAREPFVLITGEPGTGKSALVNQAIARWGSRVTAACLAFPVATGPELMEAVLQRLGSAPPDGASRARLFACLEAALAEIAGRGQVAVIVMDDAHHLSRELLEELRLLVNAAQQARRSLEVMLVGLPALEATLEDPALAALRQRVSVRAKLEPLSPGETRRYLRHRVAATGDDRSNLFPRKTCAEIATLARGVPREINALAGEALRLARDAGHPTVEPAHVRSAVAALSGALPKDEANDSAEAGAEAPATGVAAKPPVAAKAPPPATVPAPASAVPPVAAAVPPRVARPSPAASAPRPETAQAPAHTPPASHDAREWVARFVGDKGPLQIGSQAAARSTWTPASLDAESFTSAEQSDRSPALFERGAEPAPRSQAPAGDDEWPQHSRSRPKGAWSAAVTAALVVIALFALVLYGVRTSRKSGDHAASAAGVAATSGTAPKSEPSAENPRGTDRNSNAPAAIPKGPYTIDTGQHLELERAFDERERMQGLTGIQGWVVPAGDASEGKFDVVLGVFRSYARAKSAADMLMKSRTLSDVAVITLPPRHTRQ